jgi:hypothetical protein
MQLSIVPHLLQNQQLYELWPYAKGEQFKYFTQEAGNEHYKLLSHFSWQFPKGSTVIDIGTSTGHSALALSHNPNINVITYNIVDEVANSHSIKSKENIDIRIKNCIDDLDLLLKSPFIMLDVFHDGTFERIVINKLIESNYSGIVMCDDIFLNKDMVDFWNWIPKNLIKINTSEYGHWSGTGIILFGNSSLTITDIVQKPIPPYSQMDIQ